jgi:ABC-type polysaccharide/polyol phosphate export permease
MDSTVNNPLQASGVSLLRSWAVQRRVIGALLMREILTRYGRHNIGFLWLFAEPMIFTLGITFLWAFIKAKHVSNIPIVAFAVTGYSSVLLWRNMAARSIGAVGPNRALMYHRNVRIIDIFASRLLLEMVGAITSFVVLSIVFIAIGWMEPPEDYLQVAGGIAMLAWFGGALALLVGSVSERSELVEKLWHPVSYMLFPLSGAAFVVDAVPPATRELMLYIPMVNGVEFVRDGYFGSMFTAHYDMGYMALVNAALTLLALAQLRIVSNRMVLE